MGVAALDMIDVNPWSRLVLSEYGSLHGVREWTRKYLRGLRGLPRNPINKPYRPVNRTSR